MKTPVPASPAAQRRPPGRLIIIHSGLTLTQQEYWRALEGFAAEDEKVWHRRLKKAGIQPLTAAQQHTWYVGSWKYAPLRLDRGLLKPAAIMSKL